MAKADVDVFVTQMYLLVDDPKSLAHQLGIQSLFRLQVARAEKAEARVRELEADLNTARETNQRLNRRVQEAESGLTLGKYVNRWQASSDNYAKAAARIRELEAEVERLKHENFTLKLLRDDLKPFMRGSLMTEMGRLIQTQQIVDSWNRAIALDAAKGGTHGSE